MTTVRRHSLFTAFVLLAAVVGHDVVRGLIEYSQQDRSASHLVLIPFIVAALLYQDRQTIFSSTRFAYWTGGGLMAGGLVLFGAAAYARASGRQELWLPLSAASLIGMWIGGFVFVYGRRAARAALFPLLFLLLAIPLPAPVLAWAVGALKAGSAEAVAGLFSLTGTVYLRDGFLFHLPDLSIEIADACSGIRSSIALTITSLLAGHLFLDTPWKKAVLVAAVLPITVFKNAVRIVTLTLLSIHVDPSFLSGQLHHDGGIFFFLLGLAMMTPILFLLSRPRRAAARDSKDSLISAH